MKKFLLILSVILILAIIFVPYNIKTLDDGGTKVYTSLVYRVVKWNYKYDFSLYTEDFKIYNETEIFWLPHNFDKIADLQYQLEEKWRNKKVDVGFGDKESVKISVNEIISDINSLTVKYGDVSFEKGEQSINVSFLNNSAVAMAYCPYDYDILYCPQKGERDIEKFTTCALKPREIAELAMIIKAKKSTPSSYEVAEFDLTETVGEYCLMIRIAQNKDGNDKFIKMFFNVVEV